MTIHVPPELRESQLSYIVQGLDQYYASKTISYAQLEDSLRRMSDEDLQSILVYSASADFINIASAVLNERGTESVPVKAPPPPKVVPEVLF